MQGNESVFSVSFFSSVRLLFYKSIKSQAFCSGLERGFMCAARVLFVSRQCGLTPAGRSSLVIFGFGVCQNVRL